MRDGGAFRSLLAARPAFGASTEAEDLFQITNRHLKLGRVRWLEVGAGDGRHLDFQVQRLSSSREMRVVALEPESAAPPMSTGIIWLKRRLEDYRPDRHFDWINMRHSGYYVRDLVSQIGRISDSLSVEGALAITHWARSCILRQLHIKICGELDDIPVASIEELAAVLAKDSNLTIATFEQRDTDFLVDEVAASPAVANALYDLARRGRPPLHPVFDPVELISDCLGSLPSEIRRHNGVVLIRRRR
jgi:hypothetical protein